MDRIILPSAVALVISACSTGPGPATNPPDAAAPAATAELSGGDAGDAATCADGAAPSPEVCNDGVDQDCNGIVDDGCPTLDAGLSMDGLIEFHHLPDTAGATNCLKIQVNGGPEADLGCNRGSPLVSTSIAVYTPPFCNIVRLNLYSDGVFDKSTKNAADVPRSFIIKELSPGNFSVQCNDNSDNDFNDLNLTMNAVGDVRFTIENAGIPCD